MKAGTKKEDEFPIRYLLNFSNTYNIYTRFGVLVLLMVLEHSDLP